MKTENRALISTIVTHILVWSGVLVIMFYFKSFGPNKDESFDKFMVLLGPLAGIYYFNYHVLIPKFLFQKKFWIYIGIIAAMALVLFLIPTEWIEPKPRLFFDGADKGPGRHQPPFKPIPIVLMLITVLIGLVIRMTSRWLEQDKLTVEIKNNQLQTELSWLKNQLSPHFFFNTLNNIYALTETSPEEARSVIHRLSKMMRYMLYESENSNNVVLQKEVEFVQNYVHLMQGRMAESVRIECTVNVIDVNIKVPPMLFIGFVENAFKHGITMNQPCKIAIAFSSSKDELIFTCQNNKFTASNTLEEGGIGLQNVQRRLKLLYPERVDLLHITEDDTTYLVTLKLPI